MPKRKSTPTKKDIRPDESGHVIVGGNSPGEQNASLNGAPASPLQQTALPGADGDGGKSGEESSSVGLGEAADLPVPLDKKQRQNVYLSEGRDPEEIARLYCTEDGNKKDMGYLAHSQFLTAARVDAVRRGSYKIVRKELQAEPGSFRLTVNFTDGGGRERVEEVPYYDEETARDIVQCALRRSTTARRRRGLTPAKCSFLFNAEKVADRSPPLYWSLASRKLPIDAGIETVLEEALVAAISMLVEE